VEIDLAAARAGEPPALHCGLTDIVARATFAFPHIPVVRVPISFAHDDTMTKFNSDFFTTFSHAQVRSRGRMLHVEADNALYSVTYRLADSLPREVLVDLRERRMELLNRLEREQASEVERSAALALLHQVEDAYLDEGYGSCILRNPEVAAIVQEKLLFHDSKLFGLEAWNIMPNHVHVAIQLYRGSDLARVLHSWKSYTSHEINRLLGLKGPRWQIEYWDRLIRDEDDQMNTYRYIYENSDAAGLKDWKWRGVRVDGEKFLR
jgi:REP element-mobilizing transposase RayT